MTEGTMQGIAGKNVLVVGASAGIGRAFAVDAARAGANVTVSARRLDRLQDTLADAGSGLAVACDVCDPDSVRAAVDAATAEFGPIDLVLYAAGFAPLLTLAETEPAVWAEVFNTNVIGVNQVITASLGHLAPGAVVAVLSSETAQQPRFALGAYAASKAALESLLRNWRLERTDVRFSCVQVGATQPTEFGNAFGADTLGPALDQWTLHGLMQEEFMETDHVAAWLVTTFASALAYPGVGVETVSLRSPTPPIGAEKFARVFSDDNIRETQGH